MSIHPVNKYVYIPSTTIVGENELSSFNLHTPVNVSLLQKYLKGYWDERYIIEGFSQGFSLGLKESPTLMPCSKVYPVKTELVSKVTDEVRKGRIIGPFSDPPLSDLMISPIQLIPKPNSNKDRMIFNLSSPSGLSVNDNIPESATSVTYCSVNDVARWIMGNKATKTWFMAKVDLTDAYRMVPIKKNVNGSF